MGRLPDAFAGRPIRFRIPYVMAGERTLAGSLSGQVFPDATFLHSIDLPFEIHRMIPRVTGLDANNGVVATQPDQDILQSLVRLRIQDTGKANAQLTRTSTLMKLFSKGTSERSWEFAEPYYLTRAEGFLVEIDTLAIPVFAAPITNLRIEICFQGFLVTNAPPSEAR